MKYADFWKYTRYGISQFAPTGGVVDDLVTISGSDFTGVTDVSFNGTSASIVGTPTGTSITVRVPVGFNYGPITVTTPLGTYTSVEHFKAPPTITSFSPLSGPAGNPVSIVGTNLQNATGNCIPLPGILCRCR